MVWLGTYQTPSIKTIKVLFQIGGQSGYHDSITLFPINDCH
jgi:hypothetical protein